VNEIEQELDKRIPRLTERLPLPERGLVFQQQEWMGDPIIKHYQSALIGNLFPNGRLKQWQAIRQCVESNNCFAWLYDMCDYATLYPGHEDYLQKAKGDFIEVMTFHINQIGGETEVLRIFGPLWQSLMRLANVVFQKKPRISEMQNKEPVGRGGREAKKGRGEWRFEESGKAGPKIRMRRMFRMRW